MALIFTVFLLILIALNIITVLIALNTMQKKTSDDFFDRVDNDSDLRWR
jgi:hypothetical protein